MKKTAEEPETDVRIVNVRSNRPYSWDDQIYTESANVQVSSDAMKIPGGVINFKTKEDFNRTYDKEYVKLQQIMKVYGNPTIVLWCFLLGFNPLFVLGHSKLAGSLFFAELQKRLDKEKSPVLTVSIHPGGILTGKSGYIIFVSLNNGFVPRL